MQTILPGNSSVLRINRIEKFGLNLLLYAKLLTTTTAGLGVLSLLAVSRKSLKLAPRELLFVGLVFFQLAVSLLLSGSSAAANNTLFYYSFLPVYFLLKDRNDNELIKFLRYLMSVMMIFTLIEFFALNTSLSSYVWYFGEDHVHRSLIMGFQRAQGLSQISSSSGVVAVITLALYSVVSKREDLKYHIITATNILFLMSGSGFFIYALYLLLTTFFKLTGVFYKTIIICSVITTIVAMLLFFEEIGLDKFTITYLLDIYDIKLLDYFNSEFSGDFIGSMFGSQASLRDAQVVTTSDFAILGLYQGMGIFSVFLLLNAQILVVGYIKQYKIVTALCIVSWLHYPALPSPVGALFFGIFLSLCRNSQRTILFRNERKSTIRSTV